MGRKETTMDLKKIAGTATLAGALGAAALGLGAGSAQAQPKWNPNPVVPFNIDFTRPPGQISHVLGTPPGQFKKIEFVRFELSDGTISEPRRNPFFGVPPGHWRITDFSVPPS